MRQSHDAHISKLIINSEDGTSSINSKKFWSLIKKLKKDIIMEYRLVTPIIKLLLIAKKRQMFLTHTLNQYSPMNKIIYLTKVPAHIQSWRISM